MENNYSEGPWYIAKKKENKHGSMTHTIDSVTGTNIAQVYTAVGARDNTPNLIAVAPEMYEALNRAINTIELLASELNYTSQRWQSEHLDPLQIVLNKANPQPVIK